MPRVKLIRHGCDDDGNDHWGFPIYPYGECPHPPGALRFDSRYAVPSWCYCRACGEPGISPWHGATDEEIEVARQEARELADALGLDWG